MTSWKSEGVRKGVEQVPGIPPASSVPALGAAGAVKPAGAAAKRSAAGADFQQILAERLGAQEVRFSAHALQRLRAAGIQFGPEQQRKLQQAVEKVAAKGARESLVLMDNLALVVSVKNRTVITAVDGARIRENVFTNIDSAVIT